MEKRPRPQSLQRHRPKKPRVPLTPEEIARVQERGQRNKAHFSQLQKMFRRAFIALMPYTSAHATTEPSWLRYPEASTALRKQSPLCGQRQYVEETFERCVDEKESPQQHDRLSSYTLLKSEESNTVEDLRYAHTAFVDMVQEHLLRLFEQARAERQRAQALRSQSRQLRDWLGQLRAQRRKLCGEQWKP